jgi:eukaryotic-like serine/threonine-protein kinase
MTIAPGTFLGSYEILAPLGAGGMGEVFRARDTRIGRDVAIKVLPAAMTGDANGLRRFEQEARAAGGLNHPNLVTIHEFGLHEAAPFIVMELLEGETLRAAIGLGDANGTARLPVRKVIDYAAQVANGLAAAHDKGIVHRDLKPENIFVTSDGRVKILDFGLAKLAAHVDADTTETRTQKRNTEPGTVMGTADYMSPEQVRGQQVDHRSDIFSFGSILYEMLIGRRPFRGDCAADTMSAILHKDPPEVTPSRPNAPPAIERIARHCMEKNPSQRFQSAQDLAFDLATCSLESTGERPVMNRRRSSFVIGALALLMMVGAIGMAVGRRSVKPAERTKRAETLSFHQVTFRRGNIMHARFGPDGQTIYYGAALEGGGGQVYSSRADASEMHALGIMGDVVAVSPSGELAVIIKKHQPNVPNGTGTLATVPAGGGTPRELVSDTAAADWSPDGSDLAVMRFGRDGGQLGIEWPIGHQIAALKDANENLRISPDGHQVAFTEPNSGGSYIRVVDRSGREIAKVGPFVGGSNSFTWTRDSRAFIVAMNSSHGDTALLRCGLKSDCTSLSSAPRQITVHDIAADGRLLIEEGTSRDTLQIIDTHTGDQRDLSWLGGTVVAGISADGDALLIWEDGTAGAPQPGVYYRKTDGSPPVRLGDGYPLALSDDSNWVLAADRQRGAKLSLVPTGPGSSRTFAPPWSSVLSARFLPNGNRAIVVALDPTRVARAYELDLTTGVIRSAAPSLTGVARAVVSTNGKQLAVRTRQGTYVVEIAGRAATPIGGLTLNDVPISWSDDGRTLYIVPRTEVPPSIYRFDPATGRRNLVRRLVPADPSGVMNVGSVFMTSDGRTIAYSTFRAESSSLFIADSK